MPFDAVTVELYMAGAWRNVTSDVVAAEPLRVRYGCWGHGPSARVSETGSMRFSLDNSAQNSGGKLGYYSPGHADCRSGFTHGVRVRLTCTLAGTDYVRFIGKLVEITPVAGVRGLRQTLVLAYDWIDELASFDVREVDPQENKRGDELLQAVIDAMPADAQPVVAPTLLPGTDVFPYAFQDLGSGTSGLAVAQAIAQSDYSYIDQHGSGILYYRSRHSVTGSLSGGISYGASQIRELVVSGSLRTTFNMVRTVVHPKEVDAAVVTLWQQQGTPLYLGVGETKVVWAAYVSPDNELQFAGLKSGTGVAPVASSDYVANSLADGTGSDQTGSVTVSATYFATTVKLTIANGAGVPVYMTTLRVRGQGIYDLDEQVFESKSTQTYGRRQFELNMPYQSDVNTGAALADYILDTYEDANPRVELVGLTMREANDNLSNSVNIEPGQLLIVTESVTGMSSKYCRVMGVEFELMPNGKFRGLRYSVEQVQQLASDVWRLDNGELGTTTVLAGV